MQDRLRAQPSLDIGLDLIERLQVDDERDHFVPLEFDEQTSEHRLYRRRRDRTEVRYVDVHIAEVAETRGDEVNVLFVECDAGRLRRVQHGDGLQALAQLSA